MRDLEAKVKDQEEELDEQAGNIQMLEQVQILTQFYSWYLVVWSSVVRELQLFTGLLLIFWKRAEAGRALR